MLVTGAAGFVGFHVTQELVKGWRASVVGLDNFNDYYDVQLKKVVHKLSLRDITEC